MQYRVTTWLSRQTALVLLALWLLPPPASGQAFRIEVRPVWRGQAIALDKAVQGPAGDSLLFHTLKFYLGHFEFLNHGATVFQDPGYHLLDLEAENSLDLLFKLPENLHFDSLRFAFGTDSLSNVSGALGGALDPSRGMYWSWQSGYINAKIEGQAERSPARGHHFQLHLGGYLPPAETLRKVVVSAAPKPRHLRLDWDLASFFEQIDWPTQHSIMSPGPAAAQAATRLAQAFRNHAP
ncbi:MAG: hypothetical protein IT260_16040 [Saprospiraceae bacterium]|nr:hypothetical protein [Saprospiraceae bacterium]